MRGPNDQKQSFKEFSMNIGFNVPPYTGNEDRYVLEAMRSKKLSGDGNYGKKCEKWFEEKLGFKRVFLTPSCTHALEISAMLIDTQPGDEIIMPSYTFVSTANAFVLRGAKIVFVDIRPDTMNLDENKIEDAITSRTKAIVPVHYAGVSCEMSKIREIAQRRNLIIIEDAAQGLMSTYQSKPLGGHGSISTFSFHETKNLSSGGEGGLLIVNDDRFIQRATILREKGTNRSQFFQGMIDKYTWVDIGSSYLPSEIQAAYLWGQLEIARTITDNRVETWKRYSEGLMPLQAAGKIELPTVPHDAKHNGHMFYIKCKNLDERTKLISHLRNRNAHAVFHYVPLHTAPAGIKYGRFHGEDKYTTKESQRLLRLPLWYGMKKTEADYVISSVNGFYL